MFTKLKEKLKGGVWSFLALIIVMLLAGPELAISYELMAMVELMGAPTFVLAYLAAIRLMFDKPIKWLKRFEKHSLFFIPTWTQLKSMPALAIHALPERLMMLTLFIFWLISLVIFYHQ